MIVVDTNVVAYLLIPGQRTQEAEKVYQLDPDWHAPLLWHSEFLNVLALYVQNGYVSISDAFSALNAAEKLMKQGQHAVIGEDVLRLAAESRCTAYDCEFVCLAQDLNSKFVTVDKKVLKQFPSVATTPAEFLVKDT